VISDTESESVLSWPDTDYCPATNGITVSRFLLQRSRHSIQKHMEGSTQIHLQFLLSAVSALQKQNESLQKSLQDAQSKLNNLEQSENIHSSVK